MSNTALTEAVYYILLSLMQPMHGYGIMQNVEQLSNGRVKLAAGTLYGAINTQNEKVSTTKKTRFYFDGNNLAYIKTVLGNKEKTLKVEISENIDNNIFTIPSDYEEQ